MMSNQIKVAIVEDDLSLQNMYKIKLEIDGFTVFTADNGRQGLKVIEANMPDLVLLDLRMPIMSGDEMLTQLRTHEWGSSIRVIVLTNISKDEAPQSLRFLGVDRYIVKAHSTPAQVVEIIQEVLGITKPA
jgi:DNA-binding response OmpR family regulator